MRKLLIIILLVCTLTIPVSAMEFTPPQVPSAGEEVMPEGYETFGEGLWSLIRTALSQLSPAFAEACGVCLSAVAAVLLSGLAGSFTGKQEKVVRMVGALMIGCLLLQKTTSFVSMSRDVIDELSSYGKMLLPVMAAALSAQGGVTSAAGIYCGTLVFDTILSTAITEILLPLVYIYIALSIANTAFDSEALKEIKGFAKWITVWTLKLILYIFTGYIGITGVVSGTVDASAIKAAKIAISGMVPVVGNIISDASETILVSAGVMKNSAGIYGLLAVLSVTINPFLQVGLQYLLLKMTAAVCKVIGGKQETSLIGDFSTAMGFLLAITGAMCLMLMISLVCFMKGVT